MLNWVAERDEEDFEAEYSRSFGWTGLIVLADGITQDPMVFNLRPLASANRNQLKVRGNNAWDAIKAFMQFGIGHLSLRLQEQSHGHGWQEVVIRAMPAMSRRTTVDQ
jgi:hypothetical protein